MGAGQTEPDRRPAPMRTVDVDRSDASDAWRTELIFLPDDGSATRFESRDGTIDEAGVVLLTPSNPGFWWGNTLRFDRAPRVGDFARWTQRFAELVHAVQPASTHMTFGWEGDERGVVEPFVAAGFEYVVTITLAVDDVAMVAAPHRDGRMSAGPISGDDWESLCELLVDTRDLQHAEVDHRRFATGCIANWRELEARGQGRWFGIFEHGLMLSALGVFAEAACGTDGRRVGRFQQVVTRPAARRRGLAGMLVEHASRHAFDHLDIDRLIIAADENDVARRVYEACGFRVHSRQRGLERGGRAADAA